LNIRYSICEAHGRLVPDGSLERRKELPEDIMESAGFSRVSGSPHAWRFARRGADVELQVAALAASSSRGGPFSVALEQAVSRKIEGQKVLTPRIEDYLILKLLAAATAISPTSSPPSSRTRSSARRRSRSRPSARSVKDCAPFGGVDP
jgi:hypothetical protein